jgi:hypothetical protein
MFYLKKVGLPDTKSINENNFLHSYQWLFRWHDLHIRWQANKP